MTSEITIGVVRLLGPKTSGGSAPSEKPAANKKKSVICPRFKM
jgi:hypothetical protein